jgi:aspartate beta-hydroxylase
MRDLAAREAEADALLARKPASLAGLILKGDCRLAAGDERAAASFYRAAQRRARRLDPPPPAMAAELERIAHLLARVGNNFRAHLEEWLAAAGLTGEAVGPRFAEALAILFGEKQVTLDLQRPSVFYMPGLPPLRYYEREALPWTATIEAATDTIREELRALLADEAGFKPYVEGERNRPHHNFLGLLDDPRWSAFYLIEDGAMHAVNAARCPRTMAALADVPLCEMPGRTPSVHFSLLRPGARIPPHTGMLNTRLICHLPLIVPGNCALRVGGETRRWEDRKTLIFDDSIVHEAWNDSGDTRVILLFDIWRPELTAIERRAVAALFEAIDAYHGA